MEKESEECNSIEFDFIRNSLKLEDNNLFNLYLKDVYKDLSGKENGITKLTFTDYIKIPVFITEKLFLSFDKDSDGLLNEKEYSNGMIKLFLGTFNETAQVLFNVFDYDNDGFINKGDVKVLMSYLPLKLIGDYKNQMKSLEELDQILNETFDKEKTLDTIRSNAPVRKGSMKEIIKINSVENNNLNFKEFLEVIQNKKSDIYIHLLCFLYKNKPFEINKINSYKNLKSNKTSHLRISSVNLDKNFKDVLTIPSPSKVSNFSSTEDYLHRVNNLIRKKERDTIELIHLKNDQANKKGSMSPQKKLSTSPSKNNVHKSLIKNKSEENEKKTKKKSGEESGITGEMVIMPNRKITVKSENCNKTNLIKSSINVHDSPSLYLKNPENALTDFNILSLKPLDDDEEEKIEESIQYEDIIYKMENKIMNKYYMLIIGKEISIYRDNKKDERLFFHNLSGSFIKDNNETILKDKIKYFQFSIIMRNVSKQYYTLSEQSKKKWIEIIKKAIGNENFLDYYELFSDIDSGRFGQVKLGEHKSTGNKVAIKIIKKENLTEKEMELQKNELDSMKLFRHPNIVRLLDHYENDSYIYIVMEYLSGGTINHFMEGKNKTLSEKEVGKIIYAVAQGIKYINSFGIVHRDIKPQNIMFTNQSESAEIKIIDFGLTKTLGPNEKLAEGMGTVTFVAPEVLTRKPYNKQIDLWSIGVLLYYLLSGVLPFDDSLNEEETIAKKVVFLTQVYPDEYFSKRSKEVINLIDACLNKNPDKRMTIEELLKHPWIKENCK